MDSELLKRTTNNPGIFNGKTILRRMRFKVADLLGYLAAGMTTVEILHDFPYPEPGEIKASLIYAAERIDNKSSAYDFPWN